MPKDTAAPTGDTVAAIVIDGSITDADGAVEAIAVTGVDDTNGTWEYSTDGGSTFNAIGAVSANSAILLDAAALIRFVPDASYTGTATFSYKAWDGSSGASGDTGVDTTAGSAFSVGVESASISVQGDIPDFSSGSEFLVNTETANAQKAPSAAALSGGGYVIVWDSLNQDGSGRGVYGQRYDANGNTVGTEFQVSTETANDQKTAVVTALSDGGFVVFWISDLQDGGGEGVYGQRFNAGGAAVGSEFLVNTFTDE